MKVSTQQKSDVAEELKRGEKEKQGNRVAYRKLARRLHQDDGNQRNKRWRDACFFPPAIPSPSRSLVPTPSIYLSVPDFLQSIIQLQWMKSIPNPSSRGWNRTQVVLKNEADVKFDRRWSSKSRRCSKRWRFFHCWCSSLSILRPSVVVLQEQPLLQMLASIHCS